jgi:hypothetical protein
MACSRQEAAFDFHRDIDHRRQSFKEFFSAARQKEPAHKRRPLQKTEFTQGIQKNGPTCITKISGGWGAKNTEIFKQAGR